MHVFLQESADRNRWALPLKLDLPCFEGGDGAEIAHIEIKQSKGRAVQMRLIDVSNSRNKNNVFVNFWDEYASHMVQARYNSK